jgi:hypothetical protein
MSVVHLNDCVAAETFWQCILHLERGDLITLLTDAEVPDWSFEENSFELYQISFQEVYYCPDCFLSKLITIPLQRDVITLIDESVIHRERVDVSGEGVLDHIEENQHYSDFCVDCGRWSFAYVTDAAYYSSTCIDRADLDVKHLLYLYSWNYLCEE